MSRREITDQQWEVIKPLLPVKKTNRGRPPVDPRKTLNGILYVLKTVCPWADMPRKYGSQPRVGEDYNSGQKTVRGITFGEPFFHS
jgi:transposase